MLMRYTGGYTMTAVFDGFNRPDGGVILIILFKIV